LKIAALTLITCMAAASVMAQKAPADQSFASRLQDARATLQVDDAGLHGPGATIIAEAVAASRYVLIGEDHLSREIPKFSVGICRLMARDGLDAFAVEVGPEAARIVNANLRRQDRIFSTEHFY
jgi:erythromycin esterase-like protein